jgi:hypothetical protein
MRKPAMYYFFLLALMNLYCGVVTVGCGKWMMKYYHDYHMWPHLPDFTMFIVGHPWWPYIVVGVSLIGAVVSFIPSVRSATLCHFVIALLAIDAAMFFLTAVGYCLPYYKGP